MKKIFFFATIIVFGILNTQAQQIKLNFAGNLLDSSLNHYLLDTNNCGNMLTFCDDASGIANNAYQFDGTCTMNTDSCSMTSTNYPGMSISFYMSKNFDSDSIQYGLLHFYKGTFLVYALHDSMFVTLTDSLNNNYTYGVPCSFPNDEWFCTVITFRDYGDVDFYFNQVKFNAGTTNYKLLRRECVPGFCYPLYVSFNIWDNVPFKGKFDDIRVWNYPQDTIGVSEICNKTIVPLSTSSFATSGMKIYPNPTQNILNIEALEDGEINVLDTWGRVVINQVIRKGINTISVNKLNTGNYFLIYKNQKVVYTSKILIQ